MAKPHNFFLIVGLFFGLSYLILTPPFQVPDEVNHFFRAYHIAEGNFNAVKQDNRLGGYVPKSLKTAIELNLNIKGSPFTKTSWKNIKQQINEPLSDLTPEFVDFPNVALYTPISYLPQSLSIAIAKRLGATPAVMLYVSRLVMLVLWVFAVFYSIKSLPIFPWFFTIIALIPMCVFINMSASADVVTNILGFLWISHVFKLAFGEKNISRKDVIILFLLAILLASAKYVYTPLVLLALLISKEKIVELGIKTRFLLQTSVILAAFLVAYLGSYFASKMYIPRAAYNPAYTQGIDIQEGADMNAQIHYLKSKPIEIYNVVVTGFDKTFSMLRNTYIGVLGCLDVRIPTPFVFLGYLTILLVLLYENGVYQAKIKAKQRILLFSVGFLLTFLIYLSQYLTWVHVGAAYCGSIQGRYFIPVFPLIFIGVLFFPLKKQVLLMASLMLSVAVLSAAMWSLYNRYYGFSNAQITDIQCGAETVWRDEYIGEVYFPSNINGSMFFNGTTRSDEKARSGHYSAKLSEQANYTFTYKLYNVRVGDTIHSEVWCWGAVGNLWLVSPKNKLYLAENKPIETDSAGWKKIALTYIVDKNLDGEEIAVFVENRVLSYFDDLSIQVFPKN